MRDDRPDRHSNPHASNHERRETRRRHRARAARRFSRGPRRGCVSRRPLVRLHASGAQRVDLLGDVRHAGGHPHSPHLGRSRQNARRPASSLLLAWLSPSLASVANRVRSWQTACPKCPTRRRVRGGSSRVASRAFCGACRRRRPVVASVDRESREQEWSGLPSPSPSVLCLLATAPGGVGGGGTTLLIRGQANGATSLQPACPGTPRCPWRPWSGYPPSPGIPGRGTTRCSGPATCRRACRCGR